MKLLHTWDELAADQPIPLLERRRVAGEQALLARVLLRAGCKVPLHSHDSEQFAYVLGGRVRWGLGEPGSDSRQEFEMTAGQVLLLPSNLPHEVEALEDTWILDVLAPVGPMGVDAHTQPAD